MQEPMMFPEECSTRALGHTHPSARLQHLGAEHERMRKKVLRRRRELERFEAELREIGGAISGRAMPLVEEALQLDAAIHASFAAIFRTKKLTTRARAEVAEIYETLQRDGILTPHHASQALDDWHGPEECAGGHTTSGGRADAGPGTGPEEESAQDTNFLHRGRAGHLRDLRKIFLALADAIHPDKVQSEEEKRARTEAMKELNRAYREGDLAWILELERAWNLEGSLDVGGAGDEIERRCQALERKNALLVEQFRELSQRLAALRRTGPGSVVVDVRRLRRERHPDPIAGVLEPLEKDLDVLRKLATFVQAFQNGTISLARFLRGPQLPCACCDELDFDELMIMVQRAVKATTRSASKQRRSASKQRRSASKRRRNASKRRRSASKAAAQPPR